MVQVSLPTQFNGEKQKPVGALAETLARLSVNKEIKQLRESAKEITKALPEPIQAVAGSVEKATRPNNLFTELGMAYVGPVDGHNVETLVDILEGVFLYQV